MKLLAIVKRVMKELLRDKRTLALMFLAPIVILTLMYFIFNGDEEELQLGVDNSVSSQITDNLPDKNLNLKNYHSTNNIKSKIENDHLDGFIYQDNKALHVVYTNEDPNKTSAIKQIVGQSIQKAKMNDVKKVLEKIPMTANKDKNTNISIHNKYLYGNSDSSYFDKMFPILMGFFVFLFVFLISGIALLRERTTGTLE